MAEEKKQEDREEVKVDETVETETSEEKDTENDSSRVPPEIDDGNRG